MLSAAPLLALIVGAGCLPVPPPAQDHASLFAGCYGDGDADGVRLLLETPAINLLTGTLAPGPSSTVLLYALEGSATSAEEAELTGTPARGGDDVRVVLLRSVSGTLAVSIEDQPPLGPLNREPCA
jgi:hypothetical protein